VEGSSHGLIGGSSEHLFGGTEKNETHGRRVGVSAEIRTGTSSIQIINLTVDVFHIPCVSSPYNELQKFTTQTLLSLNDMDNNSPRVLLCTSLHILQRTIFFLNFWCFTLIAVLFYYSTVNANQNYVLLYYGVIRHISIVFLFLFSPTSRWPHEWPKHVGDHCAIKLIHKTKVHLLVF